MKAIGTTIRAVARLFVGLGLVGGAMLAWLWLRGL